MRKFCPIAVVSCLNRGAFYVLDPSIKILGYVHVGKLFTTQHSPTSQLLDSAQSIYVSKLLNPTRRTAVGMIDSFMWKRYGKM